MPAPFRFGEFEFSTSPLRLRRQGAAAPLGPRALQVLRVLIEGRPRPVTKAELMDAVWPDRAVEEGNLAVQISSLRKLLGPEAISTVPGRGYRFDWPGGDEDAMRATSAEAPIAAAHGAGSVPPTAGALLGRDDELARLREALASARLVSIVGASGIGKTRLALAAAHAMDGIGPEAPCWVDLADLADPAQLPLRIGAALAVANDRAPDPTQALLEGLVGRSALVVLDNCEHHGAAVAALVNAALARASQVSWLVTSQEPLRLPAERVLRLGALALPSPEMSLTQARACGAWALLEERARAADHRFGIGEAQRAAAIDICVRLDGVPLALEMAAARLPWLGVEGVRDRLDDQLRLLHARHRGAAPRQSSLLAALSWSHGLLGATEQAVFRRLAPFRGGFSLAMMQTVVSDHDDAPTPAGPDAAIDGWRAVDALGALVDKSLVHVHGDPGAPRPRYRLLEATRQFANARLADAGETERLQARHLQASGDFAARAAERLWALGDADWLAEVEPETDNVRAALESAIAAADRRRAAALLETLNWLATLLAGGNEARLWAPRIERLIDGAPPDEGARLCLPLAFGQRNFAPTRALTTCERGLALLAEADPSARRYRLLCLAAQCHARLQQPAEAARMLAMAQAIERPDWPPRLRMFGHDASGFVSVFAGRHVDALESFRRFQALARESGADSGVVVAGHNLADVAISLGRYDEAVEQGRELVGQLRRHRNRYLLGFSLGNLGAALLQQGDLDGAAAACLEALPLLRREQNAIWLFDHLALLALERGRATDALRLLGYADRVRAAPGSPRDPGEQRALARVLEGAGAVADAATQQACRDEGAAFDDARADALARSLA